MVQNPESMTNPEQEQSFSTITVPDHLREQVLDYVAELTQEDADVSGFMLRGVASPAMRTTLLNASSSTGCSITTSGGLQDINCLDND